MARAHFVKTSRKDHTCHTGHVIPAGEGYFWAAPGFRSSRYGKKFACAKHPFKQSQLVSGLRSEPLAAIEAFEDGLEGVDSFDALESLRSELESALEDYVSQRQEALEAWPNGNSTLEEFVYTAEAARDEIAGWSTDYSDSDEPDEDDIEEQMAEDPDASREAVVEIWLQEKLEEAKDELADIVSGLEV